MKFFHLSDLHIGLKLMNKDLSEDQEYIFRQIGEYAKEEQPDAILIAGDIYDKAVPSAEAVSLFDRFVCMLKDAAPEAEIMMISGNHDSAPRVNVFRGVLSAEHIRMIGLPPEGPEDHIEKVTLQDEYGPVHFYLLPFVKPSMIRQITGSDENGNALSYQEALRLLLERETVQTEERNVIVSHQFYLPGGQDPAKTERMSSEIVTVGNIDAVPAGILERFDYAALGHIHKPMKAGKETVRYCGTPLAYSFDEAGQEKGILKIEMGEKGSIQIDPLPLIPMRKVRVLKGNLEEVLTEACDDYVTVILTDTEDLNVLDMQDRLRYAFPNLCEIRREIKGRPEYDAEFTPEKEMDPFELCCSFLGDPSGEEKEILSDVLNKIREGGES